MTENTPWIQTFTGKRLDLSPPNPDQIDIEDIAPSAVTGEQEIGLFELFPPKL